MMGKSGELRWMSCDFCSGAEIQVDYTNDRIADSFRAFIEEVKDSGWLINYNKRDEEYEHMCCDCADAALDNRD